MEFMLGHLVVWLMETTCFFKTCLQHWDRGRPQNTWVRITSLQIDDCYMGPSKYKEALNITFEDHVTYTCVYLDKIAVNKW